MKPISALIQSNCWFRSIPFQQLLEIELIKLKLVGFIPLHQQYEHAKPGNQLTKLKSKQIKSINEINFLNSLDWLIDLIQFVN